MQVIRSLSELKQALSAHANRAIVPTMGALHAGHLTLINEAKKKGDWVLCTIFVNPTQFNNPEDLLKYPRNEEMDIALLERAGCDAVYLPAVEQIYPYYPKDTQFIEVDLHPLDQVMEGFYRPGHFKGVVNVVYRFFDLIQPQRAYFGQKDFQQLSIIQHMVNQLRLPIEIVSVPTNRETSGLAMSSRNMRLSEAEKIEAAIIYKTLLWGKENAFNHSPKELREKMLIRFQEGKLEIEYLEIVEPRQLHSLSEEWQAGARVCIAAYCGKVRLIDNIELIKST